jgi:hypothetical protein
MSLVFLHTADWQLGKPFASVRDDAKRHRLQLNTARQTLRDLETSIKVLEDTHGDANARQFAVAEAAKTAQQAADQLATTRQSLAALAPTNLSDDLADVSDLPEFRLNWIRLLYWSVQIMSEKARS